jgi:hypothetical protein
MKLKFLTLLFLLSSIVRAQQVHLQTTILDAQTNRPIPNSFVSIKLKPNAYYWQSGNSDRRFYYKADTAGKVDFTTDKITVEDTITISCFNYQTQLLKLEDVPTNHIIKLIPIVKPLKYEADHSELVSVGSKKKTSKYYSAPVSPGYEQAMFMHGSQDTQGIVQTVGFYIGDGSGKGKGDATAPFRIRLFKIDTAAGPGNELTKDIIITSAKKGDAWFDVDISAYNIESPCDGFYVAISFLDSGYYKIKKDAPTLNFLGNPLEDGASPQNIIMPRLAYTLDEFEMPRSYFSINRSIGNWTRHWVNDYFNNSYMIRATIMAPK